MEEQSIGRIVRVAGPVVTAVGISPRMYDVVLVGDLNLMGEVIKLVGDRSIIQVYEDTSGIKPGEPVSNTGEPLQVELGPGLLSSIYDGVQRPLPILKEKEGDFVSRGVSAPGLDRDRKWKFTPTVGKGDELQGGMVIGEVPEGNLVHKVLVPPKVRGRVKVVSEGEFTIEETIAELESGDMLTMMQKWPVRTARPFAEKLLPDIPLVAVPQLQGLEGPRRGSGRHGSGPHRPSCEKDVDFHRGISSGVQYLAGLYLDDLSHLYLL